VIVVRAYRFRLYPSKCQQALLDSCRVLAKQLWNSLLEYTKTEYEKAGKFPSMSTLQRLTKRSGLYAQVAQDVARRLHSALWRIGQMRKKGKRSGFPRFKSIERVKSLHYPQGGFFLLANGTLKVTPFGEIHFRKHREIRGHIKCLTLKRELSGKWFAIFTVEEERRVPCVNHGCSVGIDLGLQRFATLSNKEAIENPRLYQHSEARLAALQKELSRRKKGGKNRARTKVRLARAFEWINNARRDFLHKASRKLVESYSFVAFEALASDDMARQRFGKSIHDASWAMFTNLTCYKAAEAGCTIKFVNPQGTTRTCSACGNQQEVLLSQRTYCCPSCGLSLDRDVNAAINILAKATAGTAGSHAWGNEAGALSMNQDAGRFIG
jgi:putative transposase